MKANELRIGNLIEHYKDGASVVWFLAQGETGSVNGHDESQEHFPFKPLELTEEWLIKFGFQKYIGWDDQVYWIFPSDYEDINRFELLETNAGYELPSGAICSTVHYLQNCYFFHYSKNQELTINL